MTLFDGPFLSFVVEALLAEFIVTVAGVLVAQTILKWQVNRKFGKWTLTVFQQGEAKLDSVPITPAKMKQVTEIPEDMPVFLKGMCSPYEKIQCDLMREGVELGVLKINWQKRQIIIDLDKNPKKEKNDEEVI